MRRLTNWQIHSTGHKIANHLRGEGVEQRKWPGEITGEGTGYGVLGEVRRAWDETRAAGFHWLYADGPYFLRKKPDSVRFAWDKQWFNGNGPDRRVKSLEGKGCILKPWRKAGERGDTVFVCPSNHMQHQRGYGDDAEEWCAETIAEVRKYTDRPVEARWKGSSAADDVNVRVGSMEKLFDRAWAIVTAGSTIGCEAIAAGIPVFSDKPCAVSRFSPFTLDAIDAPYEPDDDEREAWAHNICARQFDTVELRKGKAWRVMSEDLEWLQS